MWVLVRPAIPVAVQREFWDAVRAGMVVAEAASTTGVSITVAWQWVRQVGGGGVGFEDGQDVGGVVGGYAESDCKLIGVDRFAVVCEM